MRYFGGKSKISGNISEFINSVPNYLYYAEPFCGACNIAIHVDCKNKLLNDKHRYLIAMFQKLQEGWIPPSTVTEEDYYTSKKNQDKEPWLAGFVGFACSFAGKWWGGYARDKTDGNYALRGHNSILKKMKNLQTAQFTCRDFIELDYSNSLIYADPPYKNTTQYCKSLLGAFPYEEFLDWARRQNNKEGNKVLISEYKHNVPEDGVIVLEIPSRTSIRDKEGNVIETTEVLFTFR